MSTTEKKTPPSKSTKSATDGDPSAPPGTPEHLGSDRPYEGQPPDAAQDK